MNCVFLMISNVGNMDQLFLKFIRILENTGHWRYRIKKGLVYDLKTKRFIEKEFNVSFNEEYDKTIIDDVLEMTSKKSAFELVNITHNQKPWMDYHVPGKKVIIPKKSMFSYFGVNR